MKISIFSKKYFWWIFSILFLILLWQLTGQIIDSPLIFPKPAEVVKSLVKLFCNEKIYLALLHTFLRCLFTFIISFCLAFITGYFSHRFVFLNNFLEPVFAIVKSVPVISVILIALFWFKSSGLPVFAAVLMSLPVMYVNIRDGFNSVAEKNIKFFRLYDLSDFQIFKFYKLNEVQPFIKSAVRSGSGMICKVVAASEVLCLPRNAMGSLMQRAQVILESAELFALTIILVILSFIFSKFIEIIYSGFYKLIVKINAESLNKKYIVQSVLMQNRNLDFIKLEKVSLEISELNVVRHKKIFNDFNLKVEGGTKLAVMGENGSGKTTLLDFISGLLPEECVTDGKLNFVPKNNAGEKINISYVTQQNIFISGLNVLQNITLILQKKFEKNEAIFRGLKILEVCGLKEKLNYFPEQLSGGEKQRLAIARAFAFPGNILLMDEAFSSVDKKMTEEILSFLNRLVEEENRTLMFVTHNEKSAEKICQKNILKIEPREEN